MGTDSRELLHVADAHGIFSYSQLLDYLDAGGESMQELNWAARTRQIRQFLRAYFESKRRVERRKQIERKRTGTNHD